MKHEILEKDEVLLIFAIKDNKVENYYREFYGIHDIKLGYITFVSITRPIMDKIGAWTEIITHLQFDKHTHEILNGKRLTLDHWLYLGVRSWCKSLAVHWLDYYAPKEWRTWVAEMRNSDWYKGGQLNA